MRFAEGWLLAKLSLLFLFTAHLQAETASPSVSAQISPFTGKITRNKVRLRLLPSLDGQILQELAKDDLLLVVGEEEEFYAVEPPKGLKAYVFRSYVIDNVIEGDRVNVRLEPDTGSPVIAQLHTGDSIQGSISPLNSKWYEITPPSSARFYICKEYVDNVGNASMLATMEKRKEDVNTLLNSSQLLSQAELQKPFEQIHLDDVFSNLSKISKQYGDFPDQVARAKETLLKIQDLYLQKKIAYLEEKAAAHRKQAAEELPPAQSTTTLEQINKLQEAFGENMPYARVNIDSRQTASESPSGNTSYRQLPDWSQAFDRNAATAKMSAWVAAEKSLYEAWELENSAKNPKEFYEEQYNESVVVRGLIEPYQRAVSNKPGDYVLVNKSINLPIAYLYSTQINLQDYIGKELTMRVAPRPNNHFAFPAYFVLTIE